MEKINYNKFQKTISFLLKNGIKIIAIIVSIIGILSIFITAYFNTTFYHPDELTHFKYTIGIPEILISIIVVVLIIFIVQKILKKIPSKLLLILLLIASSALFIFWVKVLKLNPETDQKMIHDMAVSFLEGNIKNHIQTAQYLFLYPYQFGLTFFVSIIYKFFGQNYMNILIINCICSVINMFIIFQISKILFKNENIQKILIILLSGFALYWMFFNPHFYGNIIGLTFALGAVLFTLFYLEKNNWINLVLSGILISISILLKSNYNIFLCGIILILVLDIIKKWKLKNLLVIPIFLIGYFSINFGYSAILKCIDLDLPEGVPMISFVYMGMSEPTNLSAGWYNSSTIDIYREVGYDTNLATEKTIEKINERLSSFLQNPIVALKYYAEKLASTWLNPTFQTIFYSLPGTRYRWYPEYAHYLGYHETILSMVGGDLKKIEEFIFEIYQIITFSFAGFGLLKITKDLDLKKAFLPIIFAGGFLFHIIWETKAIYVIQYYFLLLPFAAYGINYFMENMLPQLIESLKEKLNKIKIKNQNKKSK